MEKACLQYLVTLALILGLIPVQLHADDNPAEPGKFVVAFAQDTMGNDWRIAQVRQMAEALQAYPGIRFVYTDGQGQRAKQIQDIENLIYQQVDVLVTSPRDALAATPIVSRAYRQGIPVVLVSRLIASDDYTSFIAPDNYEIAFNAGRYMAQRLGGHGRVVMLGGIPSASTAQARAKGFRDGLKDFPGITIVTDRVANFLRADAVKVMGDILQEGIEFDAVYAHSDSMAIGARLAMKKVGLDPREKVIIGIDYVSEARDAIRNGEQSASFVYPTSAKEAAEIIIRILHGEKVPKKVVVGSTMVTRENVELVEPIF